MALKIYTSGIDEWRDSIQQAFRAHVASLSIDIPEPEILAPGDIPSRTNDVVLYLSNGPYVDDDGTISELEADLQAGCAVIPIVDNLDDVPSKLPNCLHNLNAHPIGEMGALIDEIITRMWLRRSARRIFLSYRRADSSPVAYQLREGLSRRGYEVFLDECTLDLGVAVQREINWWLTDADLVLLLCTKDLAERSKWVKKEIDQANSISVPVLAVAWPDLDPGSEAEHVKLPGNLQEHQKYDLGVGDFQLVVDDSQEQSKKLTSAAHDNLLREVERYRTRGIMRRLENLLGYARDGMNAALDPRETSEIGDLELKDPARDETTYLRVLPFRATLDAAWDLHQDLRQRTEPPRRAFIFYPENDLKDPRRKGLDWGLASARYGKPPRKYSILSYKGDGASDLGELG